MSTQGKGNTANHPISVKQKKDGPVEISRQFMDLVASRDRRAVELLSEHMTMVGIGPSRPARNLEECRELVFRGYDQVPGPLEYEIIDCIETRPNDRTAVVILNSFLWWSGMSPLLRNWPLRSTYLLVRENRAWRIAHLHSSSACPNVGAGERYPRFIDELLRPGDSDSARKRILALVTDNRLQKERIDELESRLEKARRLDGFVTVCAGCRKVREKSGRLVDLEEYIEAQCDLRFTHTLCHDCQKRYFPDCAGTRAHDGPAAPGPDTGAEPSPAADGL